MQIHAVEDQFLARDGRHRVLVGLKYMLTEAFPEMESEVQQLQYAEIMKASFWDPLPWLSKV